MNRASALFRLLGDSTRLRLLRVLAQDRFNVTELTGILGVAQSGASRHLSLLKDAGLVTEEREAGFVYYRLADDLSTGSRSSRAASRDEVRRNGRAPLWPLLEAQFEDAGEDRGVREDDSRLHEVLRLRRENFETHGAARQLVPGRSWAAWARALGHLLPPLDVADIGCGEGYLTLEASRWARTVYAIDRSDRVLERARALAARRHVTNVRWKKGDLARLPLRNEVVDVALLSQALHHAADPEEALAEAARVLRPGGRVLVLDLREHDQEWVSRRFGDRRLGFPDAELDRLLRGAGLHDVRVQVGARQTGDPFTVLIASGTKPPDSSARNRTSHIAHR
ncbi:MAG: metalloregulator ArsR/SmtB family transcription factor [Acidobacteria bacterium]|nr:metalloregulator ArsR/SmtB family transcription factor [Acidobacteriota bacterium]